MLDMVSSTLICGLLSSFQRPNPSRHQSQHWLGCWQRSHYHWLHLHHCRFGYHVAHRCVGPQVRRTRPSPSSSMHDRKFFRQVQYGTQTRSALGYHQAEQAPSEQLGRAHPSDSPMPIYRSPRILWKMRKFSPQSLIKRRILSYSSCSTIPSIISKGGAIFEVVRK